MKQVIISSVILVLVIALCLVGGFMTARLTRDMTGLLNDASDLQNPDQAIEKLDIAADKWQHSSKWLESIEAHAAVDEVAICINSMRQCVLTGDLSSFRTFYVRAVAVLQHISDNERLRIHNVF